jgi:polysaccharide deacetylase family protein (PEP-CTERM system associated)
MVQVLPSKRIDYPKHILTFDIEDWFHIIDVPHLNDTTSWHKLPSIVEKNTERILRLLSECNVKATFFCLGWIADKYPSLIRAIDNDGHEIACHSYWHFPVYRQSMDIFKDETKRTIDILSSITGKRIKGYRAPSFSIIHGSEWAIEVLIEMGFQYDASILPAKRTHGGYPSFPNNPALFVVSENQSLPELPMTVFKFGSMSMPFTGGGFFRVLPYTVIRKGFNWLERKGIPGVVYLHPRDLDFDYSLPQMAYMKRLRASCGLRHTEGRIRRLMNDYSFLSCEAWLKKFPAESLPPHRSWRGKSYR